jgi:hypothetical protein
MAMLRQNQDGAMGLLRPRKPDAKFPVAQRVARHERRCRINHAGPNSSYKDRFRVTCRLRPRLWASRRCLRRKA